MRMLQIEYSFALYFFPIRDCMATLATPVATPQVELQSIYVEWESNGVESKCNRSYNHRRSCCSRPLRYRRGRKWRDGSRCPRSRSRRRGRRRPCLPGSRVSRGARR